MNASDGEAPDFEFGKCGILLYYHYSQVNFICVQSMRQTELISSVRHSTASDDKALALEVWTVQLGLENTPTATLQKGKTPINECPGYDTNY